MQAQIIQLSMGVVGAQGLRDAHLSDGIGGHLLLEAYESLCEFLDGFGSEAVVSSGGSALGDEVDDRAEECTCSHGGIDDRHSGVSEAFGAAQIQAQYLIDEPHHLFHEGGWRVVSSRGFTEFRIVLLKKVLVEQYVSVRLALKNGIPVHRIHYPYQNIKTVLELFSDVIGEDLKCPSHHGVVSSQ